MALPTVSLEGLFTTHVVDAYGGIDFDVPGAYLHIDIPKDNFLLLKWKGTFVDILYQINPEHKKNVIY